MDTATKNEHGETSRDRDTASSRVQPLGAPKNKYPTWTEARETAKIRYHQHKKKAIQLGLPEPTIGDYLLVLRTNIFGNDFRCSYCECELQIKTQYPYTKTFSFDHKTPLARGGNTRKENLCICCHQCNIIKGTLKSEDYIKLLSLLKDDKELMNEIFLNWWEGRIANKIERTQKEKSLKKGDGVIME